MNLKELRLNKGLTQKRLGDLVGLTEQSIQKYESGARKPDLETFREICKVLDLSNKKSMELLKSMSKKE